MKTSEAFKQAKLRLYPIGKARYICHALAEAAYDQSTASLAFDWHKIYSTRKPGFSTAIEVITERIGSTMALESWLHEQGIDWREGRSKGHNQMEAYRHRWLDALIEEFEAKGD